MPTHLELDQHIDALRTSGVVLRDAAAKAGLDAPVPTCPEWNVTQLVTHQGMVHRWAAANLRGDRDHQTAESEAAAAGAPDLLAWFSDGVDALIATLHETPDDAEAMVFLRDAPSPRRFWARRQAHETTMHAADAVAAGLGGWITAADMPIPPELAADGIDELLCGFITRRTGKLRSDEPYVIAVHTTDTGHAWTVRVSEEPVETTVGDETTARLATTAIPETTRGEAARPDAVLTGTAAQLYLSLWNRADEITAKGRPDVVENWRTGVQVRWR